MGSEMCIRDRLKPPPLAPGTKRRGNLTTADAPPHLLEDNGLGLQINDNWKHHAVILHTINAPDGQFVAAYIDRRHDRKQRKVLGHETIADVARSLDEQILTNEGQHWH